MLSCKDLVTLMSEYLDGNLGVGGRLSFRVHLVMCHGCRTYHHQMVAMLDAVRDLPPQDLPPGFDKVRGAVLRAAAGG